MMLIIDDMMHRMLYDMVILWNSGLSKSVALSLSSNLMQQNDSSLGDAITHCSQINTGHNIKSYNYIAATQLK